MQTQNPNFQRKVQEIFDRAAFIEEVGVKVSGIGAGWCETTLEIGPKHLQQDNFVHAGVLATLADHTAGGAAGSVVREEEIVLSVEFKINLLRPATGETLRCRAQLLRAGRTLIVAESEVFARTGNQEKLVAKATVTLAVVTR
ncbi:MAG TPA: PaaI family thioesterase [Pyrinomonadaceae bacterium]|nr:PaaI family thioesterase [Pyrinomonadaceae bacterium]